MKIANLSNRQCIIAAILGFYLIPLLFFSSYSIRLMSSHKSWMLLSLGLLLVSLGTLSLIFLLFHWEQSIKERSKGDSAHLSSFDKENKVTSLDPLLSLALPLHASVESKKESDASSSLKKSEQEEALLLKLKEREGALASTEEQNRQLSLKAEQIAQDFFDYKLFTEEQLKQKQLQLTTSQQQLDVQKSEMEKRQELIHQLDSKVHDLSYEIKTILQVQHVEAEPSYIPKGSRENIALFQSTHSLEAAQTALLEAEEEDVLLDHSTMIQTPAEASRLLKKCIDTAQKLTGTNYYGSESSRYREFPTSYFAIDQRRLYDNFRSETGALLVLYSQKEQKLVFANNAVKALLGWSPEKFIADFPSIMQEGMQEWKRGIQTLSSQPEIQMRLLAKTRQGQESLLNCHLAPVPSGIFRHYAIALFYP